MIRLIPIISLVFASTVFGQSPKWIAASELNVGDKMRMADGTSMRIAAIQTAKTNQVVYNFTVDGLHNYSVSVGGILVHNQNCEEILKQTEERITKLRQAIKGLKESIADLQSGDVFRMEKTRLSVQTRIWEKEGLANGRYVDIIEAYKILDDALREGENMLDVALATKKGLLDRSKNPGVGKN